MGFKNFFKKQWVINLIVLLIGLVLFTLGILLTNYLSNNYWLVFSVVGVCILIIFSWTKKRQHDWIKEQRRDFINKYLKTKSNKKGGKNES